MLGRTANNIYWMARYVERAENLARLLASTHHMTLLTVDADAQSRHWEAPVGLGGSVDVYRERYGETTPGSVIAYVALDGDNPNSIRTCIRQARENARAVRPQLTTEIWEGLNQTHLEFENLSYARVLERGFHEFFDWVKERSHLFRGTVYGTMRRGDAFTFSRLGTFVERADNTARFLAVKWRILVPNGPRPLSAEDYYRWAAVLRSMSAFKAYREVYSSAIEPRRVAELLVLRDDIPRSLISCTSEMAAILRGLRGYAACTRLATRVRDRMVANRIDGVLRSGLVRYLDDFVGRNGEIHRTIGREFMMVQ